jgi:hypothetical protein
MKYATEKDVVGWLKKLKTGAQGGGGSGDMLKSVYDQNNNGIVDNSELIEGRKIYVMNRPPQSGEGNNGDIWIEY